MNSTSFTTDDIIPSLTVSFPADGIESFLIYWVHNYVNNPYSIRNVEHLIPTFATINRFEQTSLFIEAVVVTNRCYVNNVRVFWMNEYTTNVVGIIQPHVLPTCPSVGGLKDSCSSERTSGHQHFPCANPNHVWVGRCNSYRTNRECRLLFENRLPSSPIVLRLPQISRPNTDVESRWRIFWYSDTLDTATQKRRSYRSPFSSLEDRMFL